MRFGSGSSHPVFEITDLEVPTGTDWSTDPGRVIGGPVELPVGRAYLWALFLRVTEPVPDVLLYLGLVEDDEWAGIQCQVGDPAFPNRLWATSTSTDIAGGVTFGIGQPITTETVQIRAALETSGPTTAPITVVSARAAFMAV